MLNNLLQEILLIFRPNNKSRHETYSTIVHPIPKENVNRILNVRNLGSIIIPSSTTTLFAYRGLNVDVEEGKVV